MSSATTRSKRMRAFTIGALVGPVLALAGLTGSAANAVVYDRASGPDYKTTIPTSVTLAPGKSTYSIDASSLFEKRHDVGSPKTYSSTIDGRAAKFANLRVGRHVITQQIQYDKYESTAANCFVTTWHDGYDDYEDSIYSIKCETPWGPAQADQGFSWLDAPYVMRLYGTDGYQFPVTLHPPDRRGDWYIFAPANIKLKQGRIFAGRLVSHDNPQAKSIKLTSSITVLGRLKATKPTISDTTPKVGQRIQAKAIGWKAGPRPAKLSYQWYANGKKIPGATRATLQVKPAQRSKKITVIVAGTSPGYSRVTLASSATQRVK